jgi:hypothetical protein
MELLHAALPTALIVSLVCCGALWLLVTMADLFFGD